MKRKTNRNELCPCGSGKKYKKCCYAKDKAANDLHQKLMNDELPFRAEIISSNGQSSSLKVLNAKIIKNGIETTLFEDEITLSTNMVDGDKTEKSSASLSVPVNSRLSSEIKISGNASVSNVTAHCEIEILNNPKKLKIKSPNGLFAIIRIAKQRDLNFNYFDVLFGSEGQYEKISSEGNKERPHIAIYPEGNGKFTRLSGRNCEIESNLIYDPSSKNIFPEKLVVAVVDFSERLILFFDFDANSNKATLTNALFE